MKLFSKTVAAAAIAGAAAIATPAAAQISGNIGIVNAPATIAASDALRTAFQQIGTTYSAQITQIQEKQQQVQTLLRQLDTNGDGSLDQAEQQAAQSAPQAQQLQTLEREIAQLSNQVESARVYAIQQILQQYSASLQTVASQNSVQMILAPDAVIYTDPAANMNDKVVAVLNQRVPSVQITPPEGWQPAQQAVGIYQEVQQILMIASARQQQAAQQQQQQTAQPTGR